MADQEQIMTQHPQGKRGVNISRAKYDTIRAGILDALRKEGPLITTELIGHVSLAQPHFEGSIPWYTESVKLDLEARGVIERIPKTRPEQLRLTGRDG
jgi:hypothetical protein